MRLFRERLPGNGAGGRASRNSLAVMCGVDPSYMTRIELGMREAPRRPIVDALVRGFRLNRLEERQFIAAAGYWPMLPWSTELGALMDFTTYAPPQAIAALCRLLPHLAEAPEMAEFDASPIAPPAPRPAPPRPRVEVERPRYGAPVAVPDRWRKEPVQWACDPIVERSAV
jgi:hypothetical protein